MTTLHQTGATRPPNVFASELMKHLAPGRAVSAAHKLAVIEDASGEPMVLSIGTDDQLFLIRRAKQKALGWEELPLSKSLGESVCAAAFEVWQGENGEVTIVLAVHDKDTPEDCRLYVTPPLPHDPASTDWSALKELWFPRPFEGKLKITQVLMGTVGDRQAPFAIVAATGSKEASHFQINADASDSSWSWRPYPLPENADEILDLALGNLFGSPGVFTLYRLGASQTLEWTGMPDPDYPDKRPTYQFKLPAAAAAIATLPGASDSVDLYVAGAGIHLFQSGSDTPLTLASASQAPNVRKLVAREDEKNWVLWAVDSDDQLQYLHAVKGSATPSFSPPVKLARSVRQIAALRSSVRLTNQLFAVHSNDTLAYRFQAPSSLEWTETQIQLPDTGRLVTTPAYSTQITLVDAAGQRQPLAEVTISASDWSYAVINGTSYVLEPSHELTVTTDVLGTLTVINPVDSLSTPTFELKAPFLAAPLLVDPATTVKERLRVIKTGDDFLKYTTCSGERIGEKVSGADREQAAQAIQSLLQDAASLQHSPRRSLRSSARAQPVRTWGMSFSQGETRFLEGEAALAIVAPRDPVTENALLSQDGLASARTLVATAVEVSDGGSILDWLFRFFAEVGHFLVQVFEGFLEVVLKIGEVLVKIVLTVARQVYKLLHFVLERVFGLDLDDFVKWLGWLFEWDDITTTQRVMVNLVNQTLRFVRAETSSLEVMVNDTFEQLKARVRLLGPIPGGDKNLKETRAQIEGDPSPQTRSIQEFFDGPAGNWANYHLLHGGALEGTATSVANDPVEAFMADVVWPAVESIKSTVLTLAADIRAAFERDSISFNELVGLLATDAVVGVLDLVQKLAVGFLEFVVDLLKSFEDSLNAPLELPFISTLYREFVGEDMTLLRSLALFFAVPITAFYKLIAGEAPFPNGKSALETVTYEELFADRATPRPVRLAASLNVATADAGAEWKPTEMDLEYSRKGGIIYCLVANVYRALDMYKAWNFINLPDSNSPGWSLALEQETMSKINRAGNVQIGLAALSVAACFPLGTGQKVAYQRGVWGIYAFDAIASFFWTVGKTRGHFKLGDGAAQKLTGAYQLLVDGVAVVVLNGLTFHEEETEFWNVLKLMQNLAYATAGGITGTMKLVPQSAAEAKVLLTAVFAGATTIGLIFEASRLGMSNKNEVYYTF